MVAFLFCCKNATVKSYLWCLFYLPYLILSYLILSYLILFLSCDTNGHDCGMIIMAAILNQDCIPLFILNPLVHHTLTSTKYFWKYRHLDTFMDHMIVTWPLWPPSWTQNYSTRLYEHFDVSHIKIHPLLSKISTFQKLQLRKSYMTFMHSVTFKIVPILFLGTTPFFNTK